MAGAMPGKDGLGTRPWLDGTSNPLVMTRRKISDAERLSVKVGLRISRPFYNKMTGWLSKSNCQSIAELARRILYKEPVIFYTKDVTMDGIARELSLLRKEINAIGFNINQVTRYFNGKTLPASKIYEALKILDEFKKISGKCDTAILIIDKVSSKLSSKSK